MHVPDDPILWKDPLWSALESAITALTDHPQSALGYRRNTEEGLNIIAINSLAKDAKLSDRPVFEVREDRGRDGRVVRRWLQVNHPGAADPMTNVKIFESIDPTPIRPSIVDRIIAYLKAWQSARAKQLNLINQHGKGSVLVKRQPGNAVPTIITATVAAQRYHVVAKTIRMAVSDGRLTDHRADGHPKNAPLRVDENEVAKLWPKRVPQIERTM